MEPVYSLTGEHWFVSEDGKTKVPSVSILSDDEGNSKHFQSVNNALQEYKWRDGDFLLATYPKNGTHVLWEIMSMLLQGSPEYITLSKMVLMMEMTPLSECDLPSPRVLNTHLRPDVLPEEFKGRKTVCGLRNPKSSAVSFYHHLHKTGSMLSESKLCLSVGKMSFSEYAKEYLFNKSIAPFGNYFDYVNYMWSLKDDPNIHLVLFEDLKLKPVETIQKINEFMGTNRSPELVQQIADATSFSKMKKAKYGTSRGVMEKAYEQKCEDPNEASSPFDDIAFRKGEIGDWKNYFTVADNELFDSVLDKWTVGKDIPFVYQ